MTNLGWDADPGPSLEGADPEILQYFQHRLAAFSELAMKSARRVLNEAVPLQMPGVKYEPMNVRIRWGYLSSAETYVVRCDLRSTPTRAFEIGLSSLEPEAITPDIEPTMRTLPELIEAWSVAIEQADIAERPGADDSTEFSFVAVFKGIDPNRSGEQILAPMTQDARGLLEYSLDLGAAELREALQRDPRRLERLAIRNLSPRVEEIIGGPTNIKAVSGLSIPEADDRLWRYMDWPKFIRLVTTQRLPLVSPKLFSDPFESALPAGHLTDEVERRREEFWANNLRGKARVSCWNVDMSDREYMWRAYAGVSGVAVRVRFSSLLKSVHPLNHMMVGLVEYLDYEDVRTRIDGADEARLIFSKRQAYDGEREFRMVCLVRDPLADEGVLELEFAIECIEAVVLNPWAPTWLVESVGELVARLDLRIGVERSRLMDPPAWLERPIDAPEPSSVVIAQRPGGVSPPDAIAGDC